MSDAYVFYCSFCKFDHAGECVEKVCIGIDVDPASAEKARDVLEEISSLINALNSGAYNAAPTTLHQCKYDGSCGCWKVDPTDPGVVTRSFTLKLAEPIKFIPLYFYLDGV